MGHHRIVALEPIVTRFNLEVMCLKHLTKDSWLQFAPTALGIRNNARNLERHAENARTLGPIKPLQSHHEVLDMLDKMPTKIEINQTVLGRHTLQMIKGLRGKPPSPVLGKGLGTIRRNEAVGHLNGIKPGLGQSLGTQAALGGIEDNNRIVCIQGMFLREIDKLFVDEILEGVLFKALALRIDIYKCIFKVSGIRHCRIGDH